MFQDVLEHSRPFWLVAGQFRALSKCSVMFKDVLRHFRSFRTGPFWSVLGCSGIPRHTRLFWVIPGPFESFRAVLERIRSFRAVLGCSELFLGCFGMF
jgi:hypothetical protein